ncbi:putative electron transfer flavoprotein FixA [Caproiciproducens sp. NJN-50]|uniref:putative electron transfer flavoprotein FixA n=1 Tax=Acutalibacteraceae TaxID=3082771 RepID=UPI000FFDFD2B|nr:MULTISPECIES: putative electron transfer flavoprotein FixA [Acutalibacteraceae]QAT50763.1 putative electron transfer flavoprotein FixA [Caproiciproducens sp. NJN-50]
MKIITCCKIVPDEQEIQVLPGKELDLTKASWKISQYDLNAIEAAKKLSAEIPSTLTALSIGNSNALEGSKIRKDILSRGPDELSLVIDDTHHFSDSLETAGAIATALKNSDGFDLVLCGTGSGDLYSQEVGVQIGALLGIPTVNNVTNIKVKGNALEVERTLEDEIEILEVSIPAVLSVSSDINVPSVPAMKEIMRAGKKPVHILDIALTDAASSVEQLSQLVPEQQERRMEIIEGDNEEAVESLYQFLRKEIL